MCNMVYYVGLYCGWDDVMFGMGWDNIGYQIILYQILDDQFLENLLAVFQ